MHALLFASVPAATFLLRLANSRRSQCHQQNQLVEDPLYSYDQVVAGSRIRVRKAPTPKKAVQRVAPAAILGNDYTVDRRGAP